MYCTDERKCTKTGDAKLIIANDIGFMFAKAPTSLSPSDFLDDQKIKEKYLPECEKYFKQYFNDIDEVLVIHYRVRLSLPV